MPVVSSGLDRAPPLTLLLSRESVIHRGSGDNCAGLRSSPTRTREALRHEHCRVLVEVKGKAIWILNVLVDAARHHGEMETSDQNNGLVDLHSRKGKGRATNGDWPIGAASCRREQQIQGNIPTPPAYLTVGEGEKGTFTLTSFYYSMRHSCVFLMFVHGGSIVICMCSVASKPMMVLCHA